jgi:hypothetical protein
MRVSLDRIYSFSFSFLKEEFIFQLAKMTMPSTHFITVELSCKKCLISILIERYLTVVWAKLYTTLKSMN